MTHLYLEQASEIKQIKTDQRQHRLLHTLYDATLEWQIEDNNLLISPRLLEILGYKPEDIPNQATQAYPELLHPDDIQPSWQKLQDCINKKTDYFINNQRIRHKQGHYLWFLGIAVLIQHNKSDPPVIFANAIDISQDKNLIQKLSEKEQQFEHIVSQVPGIIFQWYQKKNGERGFSYVSPRIEEVLQISPNEALNDWQTVNVHPDDKKGLEQSIKQSIVEQKDWNYTGRAILKDGSHRWLHGASRPIFVENGDVYFNGILMDITERHQLEASLEQKNQKLSLTNSELERTNQEIEHFAYAASHDLQEPLRSLMIYSQMLLEHSKEYGQFSDEASCILKAATRMRGIVSDILEFSNAGRIMHMQKHNPKDIIHAACENLEAIITEKNANISISELPESIFIDERLVLVLFQNLIANAIKYTTANTAPNVIISATLNKNAHQVTICIKDNGIGIPERYQQQIFDAFKRLHTRQEYEGTGIGLATCKRIVEKHHGKIWVESSGENEGSSFKFTLPIAEFLPIHS
ncbi:sensor histidine kinase [Piscirickettsia litoralis]|uniref:histidine kinase n=1 Tax=Piscirickettsia litoralis TaxID=1891921 RepID=A0ABX3A0B1_9GAMM|nr:PAS domain-containing protein [Piscirickettsia litoralis]ODN42301.1 hypothetical protein BGC07_04335 [Piscirickettsia litoralis]